MENQSKNTASADFEDVRKKAIRDFRVHIYKILADDEEIIADGEIHIAQNGFYQVFAEGDGFAFGRFAPFGSVISGSSHDASKRAFAEWDNGREVFRDEFDGLPAYARDSEIAIRAADRAEALRCSGPGADHWRKSWSEFVKKNQRFPDWQSERIVDDYASRAWVVADFVPSGGIGWIYGAPGSKKSFTVLDLACSVAAGVPWCGRSVRKGPALYISAEGNDEIHARRLAWEKHKGKRAELVKIVQAAPQLDEAQSNEFAASLPDGVKFLQAEIHDIYERSGQVPALIVIDTYGQTASDDTKASVTRYLRNIGGVIKRLAPDAAVIVIDHTTKSGDTWMGSIAKLGNVDMMAHASDRNGACVLSMRGGKGKIRGAAQFDDIKLDPVVIGIGRFYPDGREITTLAMDHAKVELSENAELMLDLIGAGTSYGELAEAFRDDPVNAGAKPATIRSRLARALTELEKADLVSIEGKAEDSLIAPIE